VERGSLACRVQPPGPRPRFLDIDQAATELVVTVEVAPGFHINANPASQPELIRPS